MHATAIATGVTIAASMPTFLVGSLGGILRTEMALDAMTLGIAVAAPFAVSTVMSPIGGHLAERMGAGRSMAIAATGSGLSLAVIGALANSVGIIVAGLVLGGLVNGLAQPASNLALARYRVRRQGFMYAVKQSSILVATMLAGISVPAVAMTLGWRWAFGLGAAAAWSLVLLVPRELRRRDRIAVHRLRTGLRPPVLSLALVSLAVAVAFATASATALASFLVVSAIDAGIGMAVAGWLLGAASASGIASRLMAGWLVDRRPEVALGVVPFMMFGGCIGYLLLATGDPMAIGAGAIVAYASGWGWSGLLIFAIVRKYSAGPARATGIIQSGMSAGAAVGPLLFGLTVARGSFTVAWLLCAGSVLVSGTLVLLAARFLPRSEAPLARVGS